MRVESGDAKSDVLVRVSRKASEEDDAELETVHEGRVVSLKQHKKDVRTVRRGQECGVILADFSDTQQGDILTFYEMVPRKPSMYDALPGEEDR